MEHIIYLDNSATTKPCKKCCEYVNKALNQYWGNPSSLHILGIESEIEISKAREAISNMIGTVPNQIIFTSSGTEANNTAIMSVANSRLKKIITTRIEHPSVLQTVKRLEEKGFEVYYLDCDKNGVINLEQLESLLDEQTCLVSIMHVNNEIGSIQPIEQASKLIKKLAPKALFHCDAVQGFGKLKINVKTLGVDLLTASAHKIHGPKGIGFLYYNKNIKLNPFITGGGQERGLRSGTEPVPQIMGFLGAIEELPNLSKTAENISEINNYARNLFEDSEFITVNSPSNALPYILNISVLGYRSETLLHFLESKNIFVSSGSACAKGEASYVLQALGLNKKYADSALRLSFSRNTTKEDINLFFDALSEAVQKIRRSKI